MKKLLSIVIPIKTSACYSFTVCMLFYSLYAWRAHFGITPQLVISFLLLSLIGGVLQCLAFSTLVIKKLPYSVRLLVFAVPFFGCVALCAWLFCWFPLRNLLAWSIALGIFLVIFAVMTLFFELYFRLSGRKYDGLLGEYQARNKPQT